MDRNEFWAITGEGAPLIGKKRDVKQEKRKARKEFFGFLIILTLAVFGLELITNWSFNG